MSIAEAPAIKPKVRRSSAGKYGFYSHRAGHIVWKLESEMDALDRVDAHLPAVGQSAGRYENEIASNEDMANDADERARYASGNDRYRLMNEAYQFRLAIENLREAELVEEGADIMFGYAPHYHGRFDLPPTVPGYRPEAIVIPYHTYRTTDPIRIAWLRRHIRERSNANLFELSADPELIAMYGKEGIYKLDGVISMETGGLVGWLPREQVEKMRDMKMAKP